MGLVWLVILVNLRLRFTLGGCFCVCVFDFDFVSSCVGLGLVIWWFRITVWVFDRLDSLIELGVGLV